MSQQRVITVTGLVKIIAIIRNIIRLPTTVAGDKGDVTNGIHFNRSIAVTVAAKATVPELRKVDASRDITHSRITRLCRKENVTTGIHRNITVMPGVSRTGAGFSAGNPVGPAVADHGVGIAIVGSAIHRKITACRDIDVPRERRVSVAGIHVRTVPASPVSKAPVPDLSESGVIARLHPHVTSGIHDNIAAESTAAAVSSVTNHDVGVVSSSACGRISDNLAVQGDVTPRDYRDIATMISTTGVTTVADVHK